MNTEANRSQAVLPVLGTVLLIGLGALLWANHHRQTAVKWLPSWQAQPAFHIARRALAAAADANHVYILGGDG